MGIRLAVYRFCTVVILCVLVAAKGAAAAEVDDSSLFVDAYNAYQKKDYLLAIEKINQLTQVFPDTPLKDVSLLLLARAGLKSGDNQLAAKAVSQFSTEFAGSPLRSSIEEELISLATRLQKGEKLPENQALRAAAVKVRNEQLALEKAAAERRERERLARIKAEQERIAREKVEAERKERERIAAEKAAKEALLAGTVVTLEKDQVIAAGQNGRLSFVVRNRSKQGEEYLLEPEAPPEYGATLAGEATPNQAVTRVTVPAGATYRGVLAFRVPADRIDGDRRDIALKVTSARFTDIGVTQKVLIVTSAPLIRVVARPAQPKALPGEQIRYRIAVLNVGSAKAEGLAVRALLPAQVDFLDAGTATVRNDSPNVVDFKIENGLETGTLAEFQVNLRLRNDSRPGQEIRCQVEVVNAQLQRKEIFTSNPVTVQGM